MKVWIASTAVAVSLLPVHPCFAQSPEPTASQRIHLSAFGVGSYVRPDYGRAPSGTGFSAGANIGFTVPGLHHLEPKLEGRYSYARSSSVSESVPSVGVALAWHAERLHPYGNLLIGPGTIHFFEPALIAPNYTQNNSLVWTYGGGVDYDVTHRWAIRMDIQGESWKLSKTDPGFHPVRAGLGVRYQFHFPSHGGPE